MIHTPTPEEIVREHIQKRQANLRRIVESEAPLIEAQIDADMENIIASDRESATQAKAFLSQVFVTLQQAAGNATRIDREWRAAMPLAIPTDNGRRELVGWSLRIPQELSFILKDYALYLGRDGVLYCKANKPWAITQQAIDERDAHAYDAQAWAAAWVEGTNSTMVEPVLLKTLPREDLEATVKWLKQKFPAELRRTIKRKLQEDAWTPQELERFNLR